MEQHKTYSTADMYKKYVEQLLIKHPNYKKQNISKLKIGLREASVILDENGKEIITYKKFTNILNLYNTKAGDYLIKGYTLDMLNGLGNLFIARIERNPNKLRLNKGDSFNLRKKLKKEGLLNGDNWKIYYTDEEYIKLKWFRPSYLKNGKLVTFKPADSGSKNLKMGFKKRMSLEISTKPQLKGFYPFIPFIKK